jgi:hypothetical protein
MNTNETFEFNSEAVAFYGPMVHQISSEYRKKYPMVDKEDIAQELWVWFATHNKKMVEWGTEDTRSIERLVAKSLRNAAYDFCLKEKARMGGYLPDDVFFYRKEFIKLILPAVISDDYSRIQSALSLGGVRSTKSLAEANDWMAYSADIKFALSKLDDKERLLVEQFYGHDIGGASLHENVLPEKTTARAAMMQANRALNKMVRVLGGFPPFHDPKDNETKEKENEEQKETD